MNAYICKVCGASSDDWRRLCNQAAAEKPDGCPRCGADVERHHQNCESAEKHCSEDCAGGQRRSKNTAPLGTAHQENYRPYGI